MGNKAQAKEKPLDGLIASLAKIVADERVVLAALPDLSIDNPSILKKHFNIEEPKGAENFTQQQIADFAAMVEKHDALVRDLQKHSAAPLAPPVTVENVRDVTRVILIDDYGYTGMEDDIWRGIDPDRSFKSTSGSAVAILADVHKSWLAADQRRQFNFLDELKADKKPLTEKKMIKKITEQAESMSIVYDMQGREPYISATNMWRCFIDARKVKEELGQIVADNFWNAGAQPHRNKG